MSPQCCKMQTAFQAAASITSPARTLPLEISDVFLRRTRGALPHPKSAGQRLSGSSQKGTPGGRTEVSRVPRVFVTDARLCWLRMNACTDFHSNPNHGRFYLREAWICRRPRGRLSFSAKKQFVEYYPYFPLEPRVKDRTPDGAAPCPPPANGILDVLRSIWYFGQFLTR